MGTPNYGEGFCELVPGTLTNEQATFRTYVYEVTSISGQPLGWHPTTPGNVIMAYSVLGVPFPDANITGPSLLCTSNRTFTINNVPTHFDVTWSVSPASLFAVDTGTGNSFVTRATSSSTSGQGTVTATLTDACGSIDIDYEVWLGKPNNNKINTFVEICEYDQGYLNAVAHHTNLEYQWYVNNTYYTDTNNEHVVYWDEFDVGNSYSIDLRVRNECGWSNWNTAAGELVVYPEYVCDTWGSFAVYPNPSSHELNILIKNMADNQKGTSHISFYNFDGELVYESITNSQLSNVDISKFQKGKYIIQIRQGDSFETQQILIE